MLATATVRRWPMYLRNVKQILRQAVPPLDERAYGYATLVDLLRAAQRDGIVRLDRDRQGVVRVFQGPQMQMPAPSAEPSVETAMAFNDSAHPIESIERDVPAATVEPDAPADHTPAIEPSETAEPGVKAPARRRRRPASPRKPRRARKPLQE